MGRIRALAIAAPRRGCHAMHRLSSPTLVRAPLRRAGKEASGSAVQFGERSLAPPSLLRSVLRCLSVLPNAQGSFGNTGPGQSKAGKFLSGVALKASDRLDEPAASFRDAFGSREVAAGNEKLLQELKIDYAQLQQRAQELREQGQTVVFVAVDWKPAGLIGIADPIKQSTPQALKDFRRQGIRLMMLTARS